MTLLFHPSRCTLFYLLLAVNLCHRASMAQRDNGDDDDDVSDDGERPLNF